MDFIRHKDAAGRTTTWFGQVLRHGTPLYFPTMLATTPAVLLPLVVLGFVFNAKRMLSGPCKWVLLAGLLFLAVAMRSGMNIGVRYAKAVETALRKPSLESTWAASPPRAVVETAV